EAEARGAAEASRAEHGSARSRWLAALAGELAVELAEGRPCPVCGSPEHPRPATRPGGAPTRQDVEALSRRAASDERALTKATAACDALAGHLAEQQELGGGLTADEAGEALASADEAVRRATGAANRRRQLGALVQRLGQDADRASGTISSLVARQAQLAESVKTSQAGIAEDQARIRSARGDFPSVTARAESLAAKTRSIQALQRALEVLSTARQAYAAHRSTALAAMAQEGFGNDPAQVREAVLPDAELAALTDRLTGYDARTADLAARLADPRLQAAARAPEPDLEALDAAAERAEELARQAQQRLGEAAGQLSRSTEAAGRLSRALSAYERIGPQVEPYVRMAELANATGKRNLAGITLPTFVLRHRFEQVIDRANERLEVMTHGRYSLRRTDEREGRGRRQGLGLVVVDHAPVDTERDPRTLSGGETFLASLSMALGLSDTVTSEAGGIELDSLFIDEGFGSLDPEALDMVMAQLERLRAGGRCVGVISHVTEMKQRIAERVSVRARGDGTSTLATTS
ncbi:SMC family ATPase, partial [uncultured Propionibacterium sp.]|uniref:SMC family ATPase n=1 Tax=uncultured Propionibacterium sp. TaxID=218066 RepID=UPI0029311658